MSRTGGPVPRLFGILIRTILPSLGEEASREAEATFRELARDARSRGAGAYLVFLSREVRSLVVAGLQERRETRHSRGWDPGGALDPLLQDVRYAFRTLGRSPGFVAVTLVSLGLAVSVSTVVFSVVNAGFLRPVPYVPNQDELVRVFSGSRRSSRGPSSFPDFLDYREMSRGLEDLAAMGGKRFSVGVVSEGTRIVEGLEVSENFFEVLGVPLARGRGFLPEDVTGGGRVAVIGHNTWRREFGGNPDVLGQSIHLNGHPHTVVGVGPPGMVGLSDPLLLEIVVPIREFREERGRLWLGVFGRLRESVTVPQVQAEFDAIARRLVERYPDLWNHDGSDPRGLNVLTNREARVPDGVPLAAVLGGIGALVGLVMLIACSNVANLLLTRAFRRRGEVAVRGAIGAPAGRVFRQLLTENLILFGTAGALGLLMTHGLARLAGSSWSVIPPPGMEISVDGRVVLFTLALTLATGLTFGLAPAVQASRQDLLPALKGMAPPLRFRFLGLRNLLVGAQVGGSLVLVLTTLLLVKSLSFARAIDPGFDPRGIATLTVDLSHREYGEEEGTRFFEGLLARTRALPDVEAVGLASAVPLQGGSTRYGGLEPEGYRPAPGENVMAGMTVITPGYLALTRMRLLAGRDFGPEDSPGTPGVILVNRSFADRFWPGEEAVGKRVGTGGDGEPFTVVGVVANVPYVSLSDEVEAHMWLPLAQHPSSEMTLHARTAGDPRAALSLMRQQVADLDPALPVIRADLMANISANATKPQRVLSAVLGAAGFLALVLAMLGIYGVVAYSVSQRSREMGLRMALGAEPARVLRLVLREGVALSLIGLVPGFLGALGAAQLLRAMFLGMSPLDPLALGGGVAILLLSVLAASLAPGIRAARGDPMKSLRSE